MRQKNKKYWSSMVIIFLGVVLLAGFMGEATVSSEVKKELDESPNILFVISDDQSWPHAGVYGAKELQTPAFDRIAQEGVLFNNAFTAAPQCSPNRAAILTGRNIWQLEEAGTHASNFPRKFQVFPDLLEKAGYQIGYTGKGWGPGNWQYNNRPRNPAGPVYSDRKLQNKPLASISDVDYAANFRAFFANRDRGKPFFFWVGAYEPHRGYEQASGLRSGKNPDNIKVPSFLPDTPEIRRDLLDYFVEIEWFDQQLAKILDLLEKKEALDNTMVVVTSDNGMPFPRAKANLYEYGTHVPLAVRWPRELPEGRVVNELTSSIDFAPTFLEVAGAEVPEQMTGTSLLKVMKSNKQDKVDSARSVVLTGRERHTHARPDNLGYPSRSIRTQNYLYIWNIKPDRWPAGNPGGSGDPPHYHDIDDSPSKAYMLKHQDEPEVRRLFHLGFEKRPPEELYNIQKDPGCLTNLAEKPEYEALRKQLHTKLDSILRAQHDPRAYGYDIFESYPRYSPMRDFEGFKKRGTYNFNY